VSDPSNGWPNYQTLCVYGWLTKDESRLRYWREQAQEAQAQANAEATQPGDNAAELAAQILAAKIEEQFEETNPLEDDDEEVSVWTDLLSAALSEVRWFKIAQAFLNSRGADGR
jgi:hypothetical protein